jgi:hypothetical protein
VNLLQDFTLETGARKNAGEGLQFPRHVVFQNDRPDFCQPVGRYGKSKQHWRMGMASTTGRTTREKVSVPAIVE